MNSAEKKSKRKGIIGTILFHTLLMFAFLFMGLKSQDPPPSEEGISINFGFINEASGNIESESTEELTEIVEEEIIEQQIESTEEIITQSLVENPQVKTTEKEKKFIKKEEPKEEVIEEKKPEINPKTLYHGSKETKTTSEGNKKAEGNQGAIDGEPNANLNFGGGIGEDGSPYQLGGRDTVYAEKPIYNLQIEGKVVVLITVDRKGNVINAIAGVQGSTTLNKKLLQKSKTAALKTKFSPKITAPNNQQGKIIYDFVLN